MTDAPPRRRRSKLRRTPVLLATAVALGAGAAALPAAAGAATVNHPANQTFTANADGWSETNSCTVLGGLLGLQTTGGTGQPASGLLGGLVGGILGGGSGGSTLDNLLGGLLGGSDSNLLGDLLDQIALAPGGESLLQGLLDDGLLGGPDGDLLNLDALLQGLVGNESIVGGVLPGVVGPDSLVGGIVGGLNTVLADLGVTCKVTNTHVAGVGNPDGALQTQVSGVLPNLVNALNLLGDPKSSWTSDWFTYTEGTPTSARFAFDARTDLGALIGDRGFTVTASLQQLGGGTQQLGEWPLEQGDSNWATRGGAVATSTLQTGKSYRIVLDISATDALNLVGSQPTLHLDNVRLSAEAGPAGPGGPGGQDGPGTPGGSGGPGTPDGGATGGDGDWIGAGGLGACTTNNANPPAAVSGKGSGKIVLTKQQLLINQRISQAGVRRVNTVIDKLTGGLTGADFQNCTVGANKFQPSLLDAIKAGAPAGAATAVQAARKTPTRVTKTGNPGAVKLSRGQLLINQRISQAAVRRVNAIQERLDGNVTAGDFRAGTLNAITLDSTGRRTFANSLPSSGPATSSFVALDIKKKAGNPGGVKLSKGQLVINQRISQAAVRRVNAIQARLRTGLTGAAIKNGSLTRATLVPGIQTGQR